MNRRMRLERPGVLLVAACCASLTVAAQPQVLEALPLPGRFTDLHQSSSGALLVSYGAWSEWGTARPSMLRRAGRWMQVPAGEAFEWRGWLVFEGLFRLPYVDEAGAAPPSPWDGGTRVVSLGTDDRFVRRVVLVDERSGRRFEAPWDSLAPLPLAQGETWLLLRCPVSHAADGGVDERVELLAWSPRSGRARVVGLLPGEPVVSCEASGSQDVIASRDGALARLVIDGGARWVQLDASGRVSRSAVDEGLVRASSDAGRRLEPLRRVNEAFVDLPELKAADGGALVGRRLDGGAPVALTPSFGGGFAIYEGLLFADEGVFVWRAAPR